MNGLFPEDSADRKTYPVYSGLLQYFPAALAAVARHSYIGNEKHNPGQPLHHDRAKSDDEADALVRHLMEGDLVGMAWRSLSFLQKHLEAKGAPVAPAARNVPAAAPPLPPSVEALIERSDEEAPLAHLKHGEAYMGEATANGPLNLPRVDEGS